MPRRDVSIEILAPTIGIQTRMQPTMIDSRACPPTVSCANAFYGAVQKDYGTSLFATGTAAALGAPSSLIYQAEFAGETTLQVFTHTKMSKYTSGADSFINDGQTYSGTWTDFWSASMHNGELIFTNGVNLLQYKAAYNSTGTVMGGITDSSYKAIAVVSFANHLNMYNVTEAGSQSTKRVRWSVAGSLSHATSDWTTGTAGFLDLIDIDGDIVTAAPLGNGAVVIYGERDIVLQEWVGGTDVYRFTKMIQGIGTPARRGVAVNGSVQYMIGRDNIYEFGGRNLLPIGNEIKSDYVKNVNQSNLSKAVAQFVEEDQELRVYVPTGSSTSVDTCYICKVSDGYAWFKEPRVATSVGKFTRGSNLTIGELVGNIGAQNWEFGDLITQAGAIVSLLDDGSGRITKMDKLVYSISSSGTSSAQAFVFDTKDLSSHRDLDSAKKSKTLNASEYMDNQTRWLSAKLEAKGNGSLYLQYSVDGGGTFYNFPESPKTLSSNWNMYTFDIDTAGPQLRIRATNSGQNEVVHIRYIKAQFIPGGEVG